MSYWQLIKQSPKDTSFGFTHFLYSSVGQSFFMSLFIPVWLSEFTMDNVTFAKIYGVATFLGAMALSQVGPWIDRMPIRKFSLLNGLFLSFGALFLSFATHWLWLGVGITFLRLSAQGLMPLTGATAMGRYFDKDRGKALSFASMGMSTGELLFPLLVVALLNQMGWDTLWRIIAVVLLVGFSSSVLLLGRKGESSITTGKRAENKALVRRLWRTPPFLMLAALAIYTPMITAGILINQNLILEAKDIPADWFAIGITAFGIMRISSSLISGPLVDRYTAVRVFPLLPIPMIIGVLALLLIDHPYTMIFFMGMVGTSISMGGVSGTALWAELFGKESIGTVKSIVSTMMVFSTALSPALFAPLYEHYFVPTLSGVIFFSVFLSWRAIRMLERKHVFATVVE
ncbi:MFS transporter [Algivirga pacifica]|uniref:MFS transporter n=1 Tax=Algivirga pacifica TaxID=1162670 RepID=A0ABP9DFK5_9BACT